MRAEASVDVAVLSPGTTLGWQRADAAFAATVRDAGATCAVVPVAIGRAGALRVHPALTDAVEALAARHAAGRLPSARALVLSTITAALLQRPRHPYAIRFDALAAANRPGAGGAWQRRLEPLALARADLLLPWSAEAGAATAVATPSIPVGVPIEMVPGAATRDIDVLAYAGNPDKRRLDVLSAALAAGDPARRVVVGGIAPEHARHWLARRGIDAPAGVEWAGIMPREAWLATLARARAFVNASHFEDHGLAPLEALSAGAALVTVPSPGPYPALAMARALAPELVAADRSAAALAAALAAAGRLTDAELRAYAIRAETLLVPHRREAIARTVREAVLPALGVR
ncbi:MAG: hypothetical protein QOK21_2684 [Solirubrobacteraceae bacterium]|jgi:glycosyltransferase involved in cell wall biosynthesis|nr:hypothetical protein [Solirubrobacteraceae bacterium]